ncbi:hypothetical protein GIB67_019725 [Kingdonia uniflora]|uniref:Uncharacterized protein n=1 Tax=Kingdonia uniflora TaxID=39325 RepID=A0A7J7MJW9_9MAGN|nr:hypothetical protein GIB67_019725 [Kingdonia uniflora]
MNGVQLYTIVHFGGDIVRPKIRSIISYVGGSTKLTSLRAHLSNEDFVTLLEETSKIRREDYKLYNFIHGCACAISSVQDFTVKPIPSHPFTYGLLISLGFGPLVDDDDAPQSNESFKTIHIDVPPSNEPSISQSNVHISNELVLTNVPQLNEPFQTIYTNVHLSNEPSISQSNIHLSNEPVLTNVPPSNEPMLTYIFLSIEPEPIIGQTETSAKFWFELQPEQVKDLLDFWFISAAYTENLYDFSKEFNFGDLYRDRIELKNHIRAYAVVNKFNLEHVLSNEYKIVTRRPPKVGYTSWRCLGLISTVMTLDSSSSLTGTPELLMLYPRYGVAYTNHVESWNNVSLKVRDLPIYVFIEELRRICSEMSYTWYLFLSLVANDGTCEHGVRALGLANVNLTTHVLEYFRNYTYKDVYEPIWIPIRGIEQWKILKIDPRVRAPIPIVRAGRPRTQRKRREKNAWSCHQTKIL